MADVKRSAYRQPVTPSGLEAIENGTLTWLDQDMYNNLNTGVLEQYLEEKNLQESFEKKLDIKTKRDHDRHQNNKKLQ